MSKARGGAKKNQHRDGRKIVASNRQARRDYDILETIEVGIVLHGAEVKSLREANVQLNDAYARIDRGELWLQGLHIAPYSHGAAFSPPIDRHRKLLAHREEIDRLRARLDQERLTLIPLAIYFKDGRAKLELGLGRGRKHVDKRQVIAERDADLEARRAMSRALSGKARAGDG
jgi:SsrA-binding protein